MAQASVQPDVWVDSNDDPREADTSGTDERSILIDYLRRYRLTMQMMKCVDLDAEQLARRSVPPSTMSLLGRVRDTWPRSNAAGFGAAWPPKTHRSFTARQIARQRLGWRTRRPGGGGRGWQVWRDEAFAEEYIAHTSDLGTLGTMRDEKTVPLRDILVHMVEEYAQHCGHADLLRECIDGRVGQ